jgi:enamine deaminase RidA (YjgF/YER057c/UK114 family)
MNREVIRVEPLSTYLERWKAPTSAVTRSGDTIYVSGLPPFDPDTGAVVHAPIERQTELVLEQMKLCLETAGSSLENVLSAMCTARRSSGLRRSTQSMPVTFPRTRPPVSSSAFRHGRDISTSRSTASRRSRCGGGA